MSKASELSGDETLDTLLEGRLGILQRKGGYRFSLDALLLADFVKLSAGQKIVDLGAGNGVVALLLASLYPAVHVTGLEIQEGMVERALRSVELNSLQRRVQIVSGDVCSIERIFPPQSFDAALSNPPYRRAKSGRINPDPERRIARHEVKGSLKDFLHAGSYLLRRGGSMVMVYPATRAVDLLQAMRGEGLEPKRLRMVHSFEAKEATLILAEGFKGGRSELKIMPPLVVYAKDRKYAAEMRAILAAT